MRFFLFMVEGGWGMWFVLAFGLITLFAALGFAREPEAGRRQALMAFQRATVFAVGSSVALNLAAVGSKVPNIPELANHPRVYFVVMEGISESLAPAILGFSLLSFAWIAAAVGERRALRVPAR